ncbi:hypothetical protein GCM10023084_53910 [Streptomyces lacrimifluminis]|uniref:Uncharacterized protein n=1 Tax=Streptomyces lacrimifluminis TaxID=1500077 RepID=A0A917NVX4_9ACTN|nr:hypothetical protein [Streptomyces lacrimifluminis]GGJ34400.1 hypothetical protein GCM10012282_33950 [Streptomyces lacrimifluminis]
MNDEQRRCTREDLRIVLNVPSYWGVTDDGFADWGDHHGEGDADDFDSYQCDGCGEFFTKAEEREDAWQAALDHLTKPGTA